MTLSIDRIRCDGHGLCAELLPEMVQLDDWGYPIIAPGPVPDALLGHARRAVFACPVLALRLTASAQPATATLVGRQRFTAAAQGAPRSFAPGGGTMERQQRTYGDLP